MSRRQLFLSLHPAVATLLKLCLHIDPRGRHLTEPSSSSHTLAAWIYDRDPFQPLKWQDDLEKFKARLAAGEDVFGEGPRGGGLTHG